jgi:phosphoribosyl 1,2-cyclic phosphodiesterase
MGIYIRVNGRGHAWPLEIGAHHSSDHRHAALQGQLHEYANTSLSILRIDGEPSRAPVHWEVLFDIGQGIVPFLVQHGNRLPDAVILSHPHFDHVSGLDWLVQSYRRQTSAKAPLPIYTSKPCWETIARIFGYLVHSERLPGILLRELRPGESQDIPEAPDLKVTAFPVFHGDFAPGASLLLVEYAEAAHGKAVLTGDLLCPLLRQADFELLRGADVLYVDAYSRFPWPRTNHWSFAAYDPRQGRETESAELAAWRREYPLTYLITPHTRAFERQTHRQYYRFFDDFLLEALQDRSQLCWSIVEFAQRMQPKRIQLVHYGGHEDLRHYGQAILNDEELLSWTQREALSYNLAAETWSVPPPGDLLRLC